MVRFFVLPPWRRTTKPGHARLLALLDASSEAALRAEIALSAGARTDCPEVLAAQEAIVAVIEELDRSVSSLDGT